MCTLKHIKEMGLVLTLSSLRPRSSPNSHHQQLNGLTLHAIREHRNSSLVGYFAFFKGLIPWRLTSMSVHAVISPDVCRCFSSLRVKIVTYNPTPLARKNKK